MVKYDSYKESGVEWIGEIPSNWKTPRLKHHITISFGGEVIDKSFWGDGDEILYTTSKKIHKSDFKGFNDERRTTDSDLLLSRNGDGIVHIPDNGSIYTNVVQLIRIKNGVDRRFLWYTLTSQIKPLNSFSDGDFIVSLNKEQWFNLLTPLPLFNEQQQIVEFLDIKTSLIDSLVEKTQRKIKLLKEQRTSLINHTVTKGLNPNIELKDSGVEWIGEVPIHWNITPLKILGNFQNGISKGSEFFGHGFPFMNYGDVYKNDITPFQVEGKVESDEVERERYSILRGDVFFTRTSESKDDIGVSSVCLKTISQCVFSGFVIRFRFYNKIQTPEYSRYHFQTHWKKVFIESRMNIVTRSSLSQQVLGQVPVLIPPLSEQQQIVEFLDKKTNLIDTTISREQKRIELLKEYRQSLISNVVTGKIKVCD